MAPLKVTVIGSGNWGSAIARIVGATAAQYSDDFNPAVNMWVHEEIWNGMKLSHVINEQHENPKYLPGKKLPENVVAVTDLIEACKDSDLLVFVVPHQFVSSVCEQLQGHLKDGVIAVSLIKDDVLHCRVQGKQRPLDEAGLMAIHKMGGIRLVSEEIQDILHIDVAVLMGANLAPEVANDNFCEATIGYEGSAETRALLKKLFQTENFRINVVKDAHTVELCGALKNIVACAAGVTDGLGYGDNTKAAVIRLGLMEITKFVEHFYPGSNLETFFESCGIADLITTCYGGRNRKVCEAFVRTGKPLKVVEEELLKGQSAQGPLCAEEVYGMLKHFQMESKFPLFCAVHKICSGEMKPSDLISCLRHHPEHYSK